MWLLLADSAGTALAVALIGAFGSLVAAIWTIVRTRRSDRKDAEDTQLAGWGDLSRELRSYMTDLRKDVDECNEDRARLNRLSLDQERQIASLEARSEAQQREIEELRARATAS